MEHVNNPVRITLGGREIALLFNARAWRLIKEHTGYDILRGSGNEQEITAVLATADKLPRVLWAITQNSSNPEPPAFDWIEDQLSLENLKDAMDGLRRALPKPREPEGESGNPPPGASLSPGSTSGPSEPSTSDSPATSSGTPPSTKSTPE